MKMTNQLNKQEKTITEEELKKEYFELCAKATVFLLQKNDVPNEALHHAKELIENNENDLTVGQCLSMPIEDVVRQFLEQIK